MDEKTLEYMGERVDKSRDIIEKIAILTQNTKAISRSAPSIVKFEDTHGNWIAIVEAANVSNPRAKKSFGRLVKTINTAVVGLINDEIRQLEAELAEL